VTAELSLALELADIADTITADGFRNQELIVVSKPDMSLVSAADKAAEGAMRGQLAVVRPDDSVLGEEFGDSGPVGAGRVRWILDPIDGTHNFVRNVPVWATLIAAEIDGVVTAGVVSAPALGRRWWAARGEGAFAGWDDRSEPIRVSDVALVRDAHLSSGWDAMLHDKAYRALSRRCWRTRGFGDFWSVVLVAEGAVDVAIEPGYPWDLAALYVIVEEAGGRCTSRTGEQSLDAGHVVATNGALHDEVLKALSSVR
jgi:histidinol-phosphatase